MDAFIFIAILLTIWFSINIMHWLFKNRLGGLLQVKYFFLLLLRREYRGSTSISSKRTLRYLVIALYVIALAWSIYTTLVAVYFGLVRGQREIVVLLPGFNITGLDLVYFLISVFIGVSLHEYMHAKIAQKNGIPVKSYGFILALILPAAFVEIDEEAFKQAGRGSRIAVLSAGVVANLVILLLVLGFLFMARSTLVSQHGFTVIDVEQSSIAQEYGLRPYDVVLKLNNRSATLDYLRELLSTNETILIEMYIYRDGAGFLSLIIVKPQNVNRLGVVIDQAPSESILGRVPVWLILAIMRQAVWLYVVNFSLMFINSMPLFITDGGRIVIDILGERKGLIVNSAFLVMIALMLLLNARI